MRTIQIDSNLSDLLAGYCIGRRKLSDKSKANSTNFPSIAISDNDLIEELKTIFSVDALTAFFVISNLDLIKAEAMTPKKPTGRPKGKKQAANELVDSLLADPELVVEASKIADDLLTTTSKKAKPETVTA